MSIIGSIAVFLLFQVWCGYQTFISNLYLAEKVAQEDAILSEQKKKEAEERSKEMTEVTLLKIQLE